MNNSQQLDFWIEKRDQLMKQIRSIPPLMDGSVVTIGRKCGNPNCKCAKGKPHPTKYITFKEPISEPGTRAKTQTIYIPRALQNEVDQWSAASKKLKDLIRKVSDAQRMIVRLHVHEKGRSPKPKGKPRKHK
jgi:hypothetical protein